MGEKKFFKKIPVFMVATSLGSSTVNMLYLHVEAVREFLVIAKLLVDVQAIYN